jgi:hypothetical protein
VKAKKIDWKNYEQLAAKIYGKLSPNSVVKHDDSIYGHDSKGPRQIDVSIRSKVGSHEILVVVQARDRQLGPDINVVGEFASVVKDVRANKGVLISRIPPTKRALAQAKSLNIDICSAFDINDRDWSDDLYVPVVVTHVIGELQPAFTFPTERSHTITLPLRPAPGFVSHDGGTTRSTLFDFIVRHVSDIGISQSGTQSFVVQDDSLSVLMNETDWVPLPYLEITAKTIVSKYYRRCKPDEYLALKNYTTGELTVAEMKLRLPAFDDSGAWDDAAAIQNLGEPVTVPVIDLWESKLWQSNQFGVRLLHLADKANW